MYGVGIGTKNEKKKAELKRKIKKKWWWVSVLKEFLKELFKRDNFYTCVIIYRFKCVTECFEML